MSENLNAYHGRWGSTLFVDEIRHRRRNGTQTKSCHLFTFPGWEDDLHAFGRILGLELVWYQRSAVLPHYDLTPTRRQRAVALGAVEVDRADLIAAIRIWRVEAQRQSDWALRLQSQEEQEELLNVPQEECGDRCRLLTPSEISAGFEEIRKNLNGEPYVS